MAKCWLDVLLSSPSLPHHSSSSLPHVSSPSLPCRDAPRHRVAFLVAGVARGFDRPRLQRAFLQHVVLPLAPSAALRDIFLALKLVNHTTSLYGKPWTEVATDAAALERGASQVLQPRAVHLSYASTDDGAVLRPSVGRGCFSRLRDGVQGFLSSIRRALLLMEQAEAQSGLAYDVVVISRPDLLHARPLARWCDPRWAGLLAGTELVTTKNDHMFVLPRAGATALSEGIRTAMTSVAVGGGSKPMCAFLDGRLRFSATEQLAPMLARALRLRARFGGARPCLRSVAPDQVAGLVRSFAPNDPTCPERGVGLRNLRPTRLQTPCRRQDREEDEEEEEPLDCVPAECL